MNKNKNLAAEADDMRDDLTVIEGLGKISAEPLYQIGFRRFADLAQYNTPAEFYQVLLERGVESIPLSRIKNKKGGKGDWLQQAKELIQKNASEHGPLETGKVEDMQELGEPPNQPNWIPEAGFSVIFDSVIDENGEQDWQTRVRYTRDFDPKSDYKVFPGVDPSLWVKWILERAGLPPLAVLEVAEGPATVEPEVPAPSPEKTRIEILEVKVSEGLSSSVPEKRLIAQVRFQISGPDAEKITADNLPFRVEIYTVDQNEGISKLVSSSRDQLQPGMLTYMSEQQFPIPDKVGRYESHCLVLLLPPGTMTAHCQGTTIKRVP